MADRNLENLPNWCAKQCQASHLSGIAIIDNQVLFKQGLVQQGQLEKIVQGDENGLRADILNSHLKSTGRTWSQTNGSSGKGKSINNLTYPQKFQSKITTPPPKKKTPVVQKAKETVDSFHSLDLVLVDQSNHGKIIVIIDFTPLNQLSKSKKKDINFVTTFLHQSKQFFEYVGWRKCMTALEPMADTFKSQRPNVSKSRWHSFGITSPPNSFLTKLICSISSVPTGQSRAEALVDSNRRMLPFLTPCRKCIGFTR
ncbi:hypothetical protein VP01_5172g1 [Puccinia sorghi]|uniref:Uncharacterized protein n=1 Tax=Puccinia sorghi TaxID=27349 RepID=A0A0L6UKV6_9BASI|nr:hypothetical protein VP01_5172g1 [Puccinia sorghi]